MLFLTKHKETLLYSLSMALLLLLLKWMEARFVVMNYRLELFAAGIAIIFTILGIWLALKLAKPKVETRIIEKEVYIEKKGEINQQQIEALGLSKRELEVLQLMAKGLSNDEIATSLFVSVSTIKTHSSNIFVKLDVKRRTQAVEKAKQLAIIQ